MIKKGTIVNIYHDPWTRCRVEGQAKIIQPECELRDGLGSYTVAFMDDPDRTPVLRQILEPGATEQCCCYDNPGDNDECKIHVRQVAA